MVTAIISITTCYYTLFSYPFTSIPSSSSPSSYKQHHHQDHLHHHHYHNPDPHTTTTTAIIITLSSSPKFMSTSSSQSLPVSFNSNMRFIITVPPILAARPGVLQMSWFEILLKKEDSRKNSHLFPYLQIYLSYFLIYKQFIASNQFLLKLYYQLLA